jgi:8-oxo-dGTP pyrophosphatase MutT (NUDIX family)
VGMADDAFSYKVLSTATAYAGDVLTVRVDAVSMPNDSQATREVVAVDDAVGIVALDDRGRVCLLRQYRHAFSRRLLEIPAGKLDVAGESPLEAGKRELKEEAGLGSEHWQLLTCFLNSAGWTTERTHVLLADRVFAAPETGFDATDEEADLQVSMVPLREALNMIDAQAITDAKTVLGLLLAARRLGLA